MGLWKDLKNAFKALANLSSKEKTKDLSDKNLDRVSIISQDSENTNVRESKDRELSVGVVNEKLYQIEDEKEKCLTNINVAGHELGVIRDNIASKNTDLKTAEDKIALKNQGMREKQVALRELEELHGRTKNGPDPIKNEHGEVTKDARLEEINQKMKSVAAEFGKLERELWPLEREKAALTREISGLIKNEQDIIKQLDGEYVKLEELERRTKTLAEKENKQFESELSSTASTRDTDSLKVNLDKSHVKREEARRNNQSHQKERY